MRIFYNRQDRQGLEGNEQKVSSTVVQTTEIKADASNDRVESQPAGGEDTAEAEQTTEEAKTTTKKAWKKKADTTV